MDEELINEEIYEMLHSVHLAGSRVRRTGLLVLLISLVDIFVLIAGVAAGVYAQISYQNSNETGAVFSSAPIWLLVNALIFTIAIATLAIFDQERRRGDATYQEISNELQVLENLDGKREVPRDLGRTARLELRFFATAADLPLIPGRIGVSAYALINITIVLISVILFGTAF